MKETRVAIANYIGDSHYGLIKEKEYILDFVREGIWEVYDTVQNMYIAVSYSHLTLPTPY